MTATKTLRSRRMADIERRAIEWLIPDWVPLGKLSVFDGDPGLGKSTLLLDWTARITTHGVVFGRQCMTGNVVLITAEDTAEDTVKPRLIAAGANESRITFLDDIEEKGKERTLDLTRDLDALADAITTTDARLLIIEPLAAFLPGVQANMDTAMRPILYSLRLLAEKHRCAIITMRHLNKSGDTKAIYRGNMTIGVSGAARSHFMAGNHPHDDSKFVLAMGKVNCGKKPKAQAYALREHTELAVPQVQWLGECDYTADEIVGHQHPDEKQQQRQSRNQRDQCAEFIARMFEQAGEEMPAAEAMARCVQAGFSDGTIKRGTRQTRRRPRRQGTQAQG